MLQSFFYNLAYLILAAAYLPHFFVRARRSGEAVRILRERLGLFPQSLKQKFEDQTVIWIHAVSVGEVMAVKKFVTMLLEHWKTACVVISTVTPTGQKIARELESERVTVCYFPFDFTFSVRKFFKMLNPLCLLLAETEIWPNLLHEAKRRQVPVGILNARLSVKSSGRYRRFWFFFKPLFESLDFVLAQTEEDAERFVSLGVFAEKVHWMGNMKYDNAFPEGHSGQDMETLRRDWNFDSKDMIWIAGSTHPGEEAMLLKIFTQLKGEFESFKMIIAPRHIERAAQLIRLIQKLNLRGFLATERGSHRDFDVLVLDQLGILKDLYAIADVVFVGGSMVRRGGQNPIEPASFKKAIVHGPYVFNFEKVYACLYHEGGSLMVKDRDQLTFALTRLLKHTQEREQLGEQAYQTILSLRGATERHLNWVLDFLAPASPERKQDVHVSQKLFSKIGGGL